MAYRRDRVAWPQHGVVLWPARMGVPFFYAAILLMLLTKRQRLILTLTQYAILTCFGIARHLARLFAWHRGPEDVDHPPPGPIAYRFALESWLTFTCTQGNLALSVMTVAGSTRTISSCPSAHPFVPREGQVVRSSMNSTATASSHPGNYIDIVQSRRHDRRIRPHPARRQPRQVGQWIEQGDVIAESGNVG